MSKVICDPNDAKDLIGKKVIASDFWNNAGGVCAELTELDFGVTRYPFLVDNEWYTFIRPLPEKTYAERQAEWVKENGVKVGTKVRFTKNFNDGEDGCECLKHPNAKGLIGEVEDINCNNIYIRVGSNNCPFLWFSPFTALEVVKESWRPFNEEEMEGLYGVTLKDEEGLRHMVTDVSKLGTPIKVRVNGWRFDSKELLDSKYTINNHRCGVCESV